jgi:hypothetical protein
MKRHSSPEKMQPPIESDEEIESINFIDIMPKRHDNWSPMTPKCEVEKQKEDGKHKNEQF